MIRLFVTILNMSIGVSICILAVMLLRLALWRAPKIFSYLLWAVVLVRLVCPVLPEADLGLVPNITLINAIMEENTISHYYVDDEVGQRDEVRESVSRHVPEESHGGFVVGKDSNAGISEEHPDTAVDHISYLPEEKVAVKDFRVRMSDKRLVAAAIVWAVVALGLMVYVAVSYAIFIHGMDKKKITTPFVAGLIHPEIYLPEGLEGWQRQLVMEHEQIHKKRFDYLVKPAAFLLCCIHWFNPLVWASFFLMERDMEASCDEAVIRKIGYDKRKDYANTLLGLSQSRGWRVGYPIAFGENHVKSRIRGVVKMKKTGIGVMIGAGALVLAAAVLLLVNSPEKDMVESVTFEGLGDGLVVDIPGETAAFLAEGESEIIDLPEEQVANFTSEPEIKEYGENFSIPDARVNEFYANEDYLPKENDFTALEGGGQETIMNYNPSRTRDQYEVLLLPKPDGGFDDIGILFSYPVEGARISDGFGSRVHPASGDILYHLGVDFAVEEGNPITAAADGTVAKTDFDADCGNYVILLHENGDATYYFHCKEIMAEEGDHVNRGEQIATVGKTGRATGALLHFAVSRDGAYIEPEFVEE